MQNKLTDVWMATSRHNKQPHPKCSHGPLTQAPTPPTFTVSLSSLSPFCVSYFMKHVEIGQIRPLEIMLCQSQPCLDSGEWWYVLPQMTESGHLIGMVTRMVERSSPRSKIYSQVRKTQVFWKGRLLFCWSTTDLSSASWLGLNKAFWGYNSACLSLCFLVNVACWMF